MEFDKECLLSDIKEFLDIRSEDHDNWSCRDYNISCDRSELENSFNLLSDLEMDNTKLFGSNYFEKLVSFDPQKTIRFIRDDINIVDQESGIEYKLSNPSTEYIIASFSLLFDEESENNSLFLSNFSLSPIHRYRDLNEFTRLKRAINSEFTRSLGFVTRKSRQEQQNNINFDDSLKALFRRTRTITIRSAENELSLNSFTELYNSFLFSLNYINLPFIEFRHIENKIKVPHRIEIRNLNAPKRIYNREPLYYYHQALSTDNPVLKFLSYYQVLEYFYNMVSEEDLKENVKLIITNPAFSTENDIIINKLIKTIKYSEYKYKEEYTLKLVLEKYVNIDELKQDLENYDINSYEHIMDGNIDFVEAPTLAGLEEQEFKKALAKRIYKIRNALIHSKEGEKHRYVPFSVHEAELRKELPLMRLLAEQVIIGSSERLNIPTLEVRSQII